MAARWRCQLAAHTGKSAIHPLSGARDAFAARVVLAEAADRSLDVQYYIWRADITGALLCEALWRAAERGVRVRLLLDDNSTRGLDDGSRRSTRIRTSRCGSSTLAPTAASGSASSRPTSRASTAAGTQVVHRGQQATIVGGRNVGDEYFGADSPVEFADLDVLAAGPVVRVCRHPSTPTGTANRPIPWRASSAGRKRRHPCAAAAGCRWNGRKRAW